MPGPLRAAHLRGVRPNDCAACHRRIAQQWRRSGHAAAWTNPEFRTATNHLQVAECLPCHAPRPLLELAGDEAAALRAGRRETGVDCHACHAWCGGYAGRFRTFGPHPMRRNRTRSPDATFCGRCHEVEFEQFRELYAPRARPAQSCADCHMPDRCDRLTQGHLLSLIHPRRPVGDHAFPVWDPRVTRGAVSVRALTARSAGPHLWVTAVLVNTGAGHRIPTGKFGDREMRLLAEAVDAAGRVVAEAEWPVRPLSPDALAPFEPQQFHLQLLPAPGAAPRQVRLVVERVNPDRSFRYELARAAALVGKDAKGD